MKTHGVSNIEGSEFDLELEAPLFRFTGLFRLSLASLALRARGLVQASNPSATGHTDALSIVNRESQVATNLSQCSCTHIFDLSFT